MLPLQRIRARSTLHVVGMSSTRLGEGGKGWGREGEDGGKGVDEGEGGV